MPFLNVFESPVKQSVPADSEICFGTVRGLNDMLYCYTESCNYAMYGFSGFLTPAARNY